MAGSHFPRESQSRSETKHPLVAQAEPHPAEHSLGGSSNQPILVISAVNDLRGSNLGAVESDVPSLSPGGFTCMIINIWSTIKDGKGLTHCNPEEGVNFFQSK